jgi:hypothetical protein
MVIVPTFFMGDHQILVGHGLCEAGDLVIITAERTATPRGRRT